MRLSLADICWPSRYLLRWVAVFFGFVAVGMVLAALFAPKKPTRDVQALARLRVYYTNVPQGELTAATVYLDAKTLDQVNPSNKFDIPAGGNPKRLMPGERDFVIQPRDRKRNALGRAEHVHRRWPSRDGGIVEFEIRRDYAKPQQP